jgi:hypothetical protein
MDSGEASTPALFRTRSRFVAAALTTHARARVAAPLLKSEAQEYMLICPLKLKSAYRGYGKHAQVIATRGSAATDGLGIGDRHRYK